MKDVDTGALSELNIIEEADMRYYPQATPPLAPLLTREVSLLSGAADTPPTPGPAPTPPVPVPCPLRPRQCLSALPAAPAAPGHRTSPEVGPIPGNDTTVDTFDTAEFVSIPRVTPARGEDTTAADPVDEIVVNNSAAAMPTTIPSFDAKKTKVFFTSEKEKEADIVMVVNIPRSRHGEEKCVEAKARELRDFADFDVYDIVDIPKDANVIGTEWVLVEKDDSVGNKVIKARLCARGDLESGKHMIPVNAPTANKITIKLLLALAASRELEVRTNDVRRAFLQTEDISRTVYIKPPVEAGLPPKDGF